MMRVVNFSGGLCSFWAAHRVVERYGPRDVVLLFADTLIEAEDLYQFNEQAAALLGVPITRICEGRTPWQLFREEGLIGNSLFPICSVRLKREPLAEWTKRHCLSAFEELQSTLFNEARQPCTIYVGFDWSEGHRVADLRRELSQYRVEAPMTETPIWDKCRMEREAEALGLHIPELYRQGFPHNNCGGRCVRAGISHFVHLYRVRPEGFLEWMEEERDTAEDFRKRGIVPFSVLKDRRGGTPKTLWLSDLKDRIDAGEKFPRDDWGGCGCGGASLAQPLDPVGPATTVSKQASEESL
jgi:hypothetical protein